MHAPYAERWPHLPPERWERAQRIVQRRWLRDVRVGDTSASATCAGLVGVRVKLDLTSFVARCECGQASPCEHALALLLTVAPPLPRAAAVPAARALGSVAPGAGETLILSMDAQDPGRLVLARADGAPVPERAAEMLRWVWWRRDSPTRLSGEARTLAQALQFLHEQGFDVRGPRRANALLGTAALFHQSSLGGTVHVRLLDPAGGGSLALAEGLADRKAHAMGGTRPPDMWALPDEIGFAAWTLDAWARGAEIVPDPTLNPRPLQGIDVELDAGCMPARLVEPAAPRGAGVTHPDLAALLARVLGETPRVDAEGHVLIPATRVVDVEEAVRAQGATIHHRRLAPAGARYLEWPEQLPEDLRGARPRLRAPFRGTLDVEPPRMSAGTVLAPYQREAVAFIVHHEHTCLLADDMGLGKTIESLAAAQFLDGRVLVVAPASARAVWKREIETFTLERAAVLGPGDDAAAAFAGDAKYVVTAYSNLESIADELTPEAFALVILDESHYVKNAATGRARLVRERLLAVPRRLVVSGTPVMNAPDEMLSQLAFLHPDEWSDAAWFRRRFAEPFTDGSPEVREAVLRRLRQFLEGVMIRREKATALPDLPSKTIQWHRIALPAEAHLAYAAEERDFAAFVASEGAGVLGTAKAGGKLERLKQTALNGKMRDALAFLHTTLDAGEKVVVFSRYRNPLKSLARELAAHGPVTLTGDSTPEERAEAAQRFQQDPACRVFLGQLVAAGTAITLTAGTHAVFLDLDWNPANHRQAMDRIHRRGQMRPVTVHFFLAEGTIDEDIAATLDEKGRMMDALLAPTSGARFDGKNAKRIVAERVVARCAAPSAP